MRRFLTIFAAVILAAAALSSCHRSRPADPGEPEVVDPRADSIPVMGFWTEDFVMKEGKVPEGATFTGLFNRLGVGAADAYALAECCGDVFDVRKLRSGNSYRAYYADSAATRPSYVVYGNDKVRSTVFQCVDSLAVWSVTKPVTVEQKYADVTISSSLWNDMRKAGSSPFVIIKLSDVFAWTVDFFGLQEDDRFRVIYDQSVCDGEVISVDTIKFAVFTRGEKNLYAIMFDQGDGGNVYWNEKGESMRKAFLKAPLQFKRISSGFSYHRKHPVTGQIKAHTAVDYAAPMGTPVVALGDGNVLSAGWGGGGGNTIKIRHNSVYTTAYLHLSKFATGIKAGAHVRQGQVIGYVGSTGTSTGPHLDFRVWKNGTPVNPLTLESPSEEPVKPENKAALDSVFVQYQELMAKLAGE